MIELICTGCCQPLFVKKSAYKAKKNRGQQDFYHKECFKPNKNWGNKYFKVSY